MYWMNQAMPQPTDWSGRCQEMIGPPIEHRLLPEGRYPEPARKNQLDHPLDRHISFGPSIIDDL
jgi:hypothetical protein